MERMIWLAPWVLTELWLSAFATLMSVVSPLRTHPASRATALVGINLLREGCAPAAETAPHCERSLWGRIPTSLRR